MVEYICYFTYVHYIKNKIVIITRINGKSPTLKIL